MLDKDLKKVFPEHPKILIIEDSTLVSRILVEQFSKIGYECNTAFTLKEAKEKLSNGSYHFLTLDIHLPDGEGEELLQDMELQNINNTKVVVYTGDKDMLTRQKLLNYGVLDYFIKDMTIASTVIEIDALFRRYYKNANATILVIDDSSTIRMSITILLESRNFQVICAADGKEGLEQLKANDIDLVILDLEMPQMHGTKVLEKIKSDAANANLPVMILSGTEPSEVISKVYKLGASDFLHKPFVYEEFLLKIDFWVDYHRKNEEILHHQKLLQEYKDAVDRSNIVSKTDTKGIITYVNDAFCKTSGYSKDELIGQSHKIIRHPDTPKEVFEDMWSTITAKKPWKGRMANRAKSGETYFVDTAITPIVDTQGKIIEFIAVRNNITELENIRIRLSDELHTTAENFEEALALSSQYEQAINESNILSRTSIDGKIIYANDKFYAVTGYTPKEVVGHNHNIIRHPDTPKSVIKQLWETILQGNIWKGLLKNKTKNGEPYWVDTVIIPITKANGEIVEFMAIRHDVTEILNLHQEIEATQRELIYRMGETAESKSKETGNHIKRVALYSKLLAELHGLEEDECDIIFAASPMHDIGKIGTPDEILKKPGALTDDEWVIMKEHTTIGYQILKGSQRPILNASAIIAYEHHEKWDGSGYPNAIKGEGIHIYGRIGAIADVFDALASDRCYKKAWSYDEVKTYFQEESGKHFDPVLTELFLANYDEFVSIKEAYKDNFD